MVISWTSQVLVVEDSQFLLFGLLSVLFPSIFNSQDPRSQAVEICSICRAVVSWRPSRVFAKLIKRLEMFRPLWECGSSLGGDKHCVTSVERLLMNQVTPSAHQSVCENENNFKTAQKSKHFQIESARVTDLVKKTGIESRNSWRSSFSPNSVFARKRACAAIKYLPQKHSPQK